MILEKGTTNLLDFPQSEIPSEKIIEDITTGLKNLHANGYIHGDLSLKNVVKFGNKYKLIDFGSATKMYRRSAISIPTTYICPMEILDDKIIFPSKIDSWALGCLSYYITTGSILFMETSQKNLASQIKERLRINNSRKNESAHKSVRQSLKKYTKNTKITKSITKLLNIDASKRYSVTDFYFDSFALPVESKESFNNNFFDGDSEMEIFGPNNGKCSNITRSQLIQIFLMININFNIPIENVFLTFKLLRKLNIEDSEYIFNGIILYSLATKLVCHVQIPLDEIIKLINLNCSQKISSVEELNLKILELLNFFEWDVDVNTLIGNITKVPAKDKMNYLIISLVMLCDVKYDVLSTSFSYKIISIIIDCMNDKKLSLKLNVDNKYQLFHVLNDVVLSIKDMNENNLFRNTIVKSYFESIGIKDLNKLMLKIDLQKIFTRFNF
jgi:serine/threonine protein kinase